MFKDNIAENYAAIYYEDTGIYYYVDDITNNLFENNVAKGLLNYDYYDVDGNLIHIELNPQYQYVDAKSRLHDLKNIYDSGSFRLIKYLFVVLDTINFRNSYGQPTDGTGENRENPCTFNQAIVSIAPNGIITFINSSEIYTLNELSLTLSRTNVTFLGNNTTLNNFNIITNSYGDSLKLYNLIFLLIVPIVF